MTWGIQQHLQWLEKHHGASPPPEGLYAVWCEPIGHISNPRWLEDGQSHPYEIAVRLADLMNKANQQWHYSTKRVSGESK